MTELATTESATAAGDLAWLLEPFAKKVPGVRSVVLATRDGLQSSRVGLDKTAGDHLAALAVGFFSLASQVSLVTGAPCETRQIALEDKQVLLFVMSAGDAPELLVDAKAPEQVGSVLAVLTDPDAEAGVIGWEMTQLIKSFTDHLTVATRQEGAPGDPVDPTTDTDDVPWASFDTDHERAFMLTRGRTTPRHAMASDSYVVPAYLPRPDAGREPIVQELLDVAVAKPRSVAEIAALLHRPLLVVKIVLSDLIDSGEVKVRQRHNPDAQLARDVLDAFKSSWPELAHRIS